MEMSTGQVVETMSADTLLVQDAIGEKVCYFEIMEELWADKPHYELLDYMDTYLPNIHVKITYVRSNRYSNSGFILFLHVSLLILQDILCIWYVLKPPNRVAKVYVDISSAKVDNMIFYHKL